MMTLINTFLADKGIYMLTLLLLSLGVAGVIVCNNYMKRTASVVLAVPELLLSNNFPNRIIRK